MYTTCQRSWQHLLLRVVAGPHLSYPSLSSLSLENCPPGLNFYRKICWSFSAPSLEMEVIILTTLFRRKKSKLLHFKRKRSTEVQTWEIKYLLVHGKKAWAHIWAELGGVSPMDVSIQQWRRQIASLLLGVLLRSHPDSWFERDLEEYLFLCVTVAMFNFKISITCFIKKGESRD